MNIKNWWKYSGILLIITAILHTLLAIAMMLKSGIFAEIVRNGVFNSIGTDFKLGMSFWFFVCGIALWILGQVLHYYIKREQQPAPKFLGWFLLIFSIIGVCFVPLSGFWLFIPQGLIILVGQKSAQIP